MEYRVHTDRGMILVDAASHSNARRLAEGDGYDVRHVDLSDCGCHYNARDDGVYLCQMHAAAPDLLAACKFILAHECDAHPCMICAAYAREAISKAEAR